MFGRGAVAPLEAPAGDRVCLVAATVSSVLGVEDAVRADMAEPWADEVVAGAIVDAEPELEVILEAAGALVVVLEVEVDAERGEADIEPLAAGAMPPWGAIAP